MIQKLKSLLTKVAIVSLLFVPAMAPVAVHAQDIGGNVSCGTNFDVNSVGSSDTSACNPKADTSGTKINNILKLVINIFSVIVGVISVIMIIIGGLKYIMSGGNDANLAGAKNTILYAVIGLVVVALAQIIVKFVLGKVANAT